MHIQESAIASRFAASSPLATRCPFDDGLPHPDITANLRAKHRSSWGAIASKARVVNARAVVERIVRRAEWADLHLCQVHNAWPTPHCVGGRMRGLRSVILQPERRAGPIHRVVLGDIPQQISPVKVLADFALPQPDRHQGISRNEGCKDYRCPVALNHQPVRVAVRQIALNDEAQGALRVVIAQSARATGPLRTDAPLASAPRATSRRELASSSSGRLMLARRRTAQLQCPSPCAGPQPPRSRARPKTAPPRRESLPRQQGCRNL